MDRNSKDAPDLGGGVKLAVAVIVIGLLVAAVESPINWAPTTTMHEVAASEASPAPTEYFPSGYTLNAGEPAPLVEQF